MGKKVNMMTEEEKIIKLYEEMYTAMINKDRAELERIHDETFALIHMTGMKQSKPEYIAAIMNGTLNYYSAFHEETNVTVNGNSASLTGKSKVAAAVFGSGKSTWRLRLNFELIRKNGEWYFTLARASSY